jgi:integrase
MRQEKYRLAKLYDANNDLDQRWFVFYSFLHPETAKMRRFRVFISSRILTATARRERAKELIRTINIKLKQGWNPFEAEALQLITAKAAIEKVLEIKRPQIRLRTFYTYKNIVKQFGVFLEKRKLERITIEEFSFSHAIDYLDWSQATYKLQNRTLNYRRMHMKALFNELIYRDYIEVNPFNKTKHLAETETSINAYAPESLALIRSHLRAYDFDLFIIAFLVFYCFIRPAEIVRLRIKDIDLKNHKIILPGKTTKNKKSEMVEIPDPLQKELELMDLKKYPSEFYIFGRKLARSKQPTAPTRIAGAWAQWTKEVKIDNFGIYALKHTGAGMAVEAGINVRDLQLQLRHHSLEMTQEYLDRFSRSPGDKLRSAFPEI